MQSFTAGRIAGVATSPSSYLFATTGDAYVRVYEYLTKELLCQYQCPQSTSKGTSIVWPSKVVRGLVEKARNCCIPLYAFLLCFVLLCVSIQQLFPSNFDFGKHLYCYSNEQIAPSPKKTPSPLEYFPTSLHQSVEPDWPRTQKSQHSIEVFNWMTTCWEGLTSLYKEIWLIISLRVCCCNQRSLSARHLS